MATPSTQNILILVIVALVAYWLGTQQTNFTNQDGTTTAFSTPTGITSTTTHIVVDPATNIAFERTDTSSFHVSKKMELLGIGTRKLAILNVYSLGLYASPALQRELAKQQSQPQRQANSRENVCQTILNSKLPRAVQLRFNMNVGPERIAEAVSQLDTKVHEEVRKSFHDLVLQGMGQGKMKKGEFMTFEWRGLDTIVVAVRGFRVGEMKDEALARGVLDLYVGPNSVSPTLRKNLGCE